MSARSGAVKRPPTRWTAHVKRCALIFSKCRIAAPATVGLRARTANEVTRDGPPAAECRHSGAQTSWHLTGRNLIPALVERLLRETMRTTGRSVATDVHGHHRTPRCIPGAFLAYFLCTSKESESAAGPKPPPALQAHTRQMLRKAHGIASKQGMQKAASKSSKAGARSREPQPQRKASARASSSSSPGSLRSRGCPGWMMATWQPSAASTSCR
jgi:hypothetical protein